MLRPAAHARPNPTPDRRIAHECEFARAFGAIVKTAHGAPVAVVEPCEIEPCGRQKFGPQRETARGKRRKADCGVELRTNVGKEIGEVVPFASPAIEYHREHDARVAAPAVVGRRKDGAKADPAQPGRTVPNRSFVAFEGRDTAAPVVKPDRAIIPAPE